MNVGRIESLTDREEIRCAAGLLIRQPGGVAEIRAFGALPNKKAVVSGYFNCLDTLADCAAALSSGGAYRNPKTRKTTQYLPAESVYLSMNAPNPALLARASNRLAEWPEDTTTDANIVRRYWILVDADPVRPKGISSTEEELKAAQQFLRQVARCLRDEFAFCSLVSGMSGNGGHLLIPVDLPNSDVTRDLVERFLTSLAHRFDTDFVKVDQSVYNAGRVVKLYGTAARKGDNTPDRPHRMARLLHLPETIEPATIEQLEAVAELLPELTAPKQMKAGFFGTQGSYQGDLGTFPMAEFITRNGLVARGPLPYQGGEKWQIDCPFNADHKSPDAMLTVSASGAPGFRCLHNSCKGKDFKAVAELLKDDETLVRFAPKTAKTNKANGEAKPVGKQESQEQRSAVVVCLADVQAEQISWLWQGYIPYGKITLIDGDPGLGKSTLTLDIAARLSTGSPLPLETTTSEPASVLLVTVEDGLADTIKPRLLAAGADSRRVRAVKTVPVPGGGDRLPQLPDDVQPLRDIVEANEVRLVIIDPLMAFLSPDINSYKDQDVRRALSPLSVMAEETGAAVVVVRHLNKAQGANAMYRGGGSIGITGAARSVLLVAPDPDNPNQRVLARVKGNNAAPPPSLTFSLEPTETGVARVRWEGATSHTADTLLAAPVNEEQRSALDEAMDFLRDLLADGPVTSSGGMAEARNAGIAPATLRRARERLHVHYFKEKGKNGFWMWELPQQEQEKPCEEPDESGTCSTCSSSGHEQVEQVAQSDPFGDGGIEWEEGTL